MLCFFLGMLLSAFSFLVGMGYQDSGDTFNPLWTDSEIIVEEIYDYRPQAEHNLDIDISRHIAMVETFLYCPQRNAFYITTRTHRPAFKKNWIILSRIIGESTPYEAARLACSSFGFQMYPVKILQRDLLRFPDSEMRKRSQRGNQSGQVRYEPVQMSIVVVFAIKCAEDDDAIESGSWVSLEEYSFEEKPFSERLNGLVAMVKKIVANHRNVIERMKYNTDLIRILAGRLALDAVDDLDGGFSASLAVPPLPLGEREDSSLRTDSFNDIRRSQASVNISLASTPRSTDSLTAGLSSGASSARSPRDAAMSPIVSPQHTAKDLTSGGSSPRDAASANTTPSTSARAILTMSPRAAEAESLSPRGVMARARASSLDGPTVGHGLTLNGYAEY